jgi:magnesium transporter
MHTLYIGQSGSSRERAPLDAIRAYLGDPKTTLWLDLEGPDDDELALLRDAFGFHPLAIEDAMRHHERPKLDTYPGTYFFVFYAAAYAGGGVMPAADRDSQAVDRPAHQLSTAQQAGQPQIDLRQLAIFVGENFIVTIHDRPIRQISERLARWSAPNTRRDDSVTNLLYELLDAIVDDYFTLTDQLGAWIDELEDTIFSRFREGAIQEIFALKQDLLVMRRVVAPERDVLNVLLRQETPIFPGAALRAMQDVYDHLMSVTDSIDTYRDLLSNALDSYLSLQSNQLNQMIKTLTLASIILMACTLIAGIYGMNFEVMPELTWIWGYPFALGLMLAISSGLVVFFRSRKWW